MFPTIDLPLKIFVPYHVPSLPAFQYGGTWIAAMEGKVVWVYTCILYWTLKCISERSETNQIFVWYGSLLQSKLTCPDEVTIIDC